MSTAGGSAFRHRDFALFWVSLVTEALALQMAVVAIGWQVYTTSGRALDLGLLGLAEFLPLLLLALPAGQLADRLPRRNLLTVMALSNVLVLAGLLAVTVADTGHLWPFFGLLNCMRHPAHHIVEMCRIPTTDDVLDVLYIE